MADGRSQRMKFAKNAQFIHAWRYFDFADFFYDIKIRKCS
jgi:hypothetical protein